MGRVGASPQPRNKRQKTTLTEAHHDGLAEQVQRPTRTSSRVAQLRARTTQTPPVQEPPVQEPPPPPVEWIHPLLSLHDERIQPELFKNKLNKDKTLIQDKAVKKEELEGYGIIECFARLGWDGVLSFKSTEVYKEEVIEWMSTLKRTGGNAQDTKLIGKVRGKTATLDLNFIRRTFGVDKGILGKPGIEYIYPTEKELAGLNVEKEAWKFRLETVFDVPDRGFRESNLKPLAKVLWRIGLWNIHPRLSDPERVRRYEVSIVYALMTGELPISYSHLILSNIWKAHELEDKKHIPHPFIISELLRIKRIIPRGVEPKPIWSNHRYITQATFSNIVFNREGHYLERASAKHKVVIDKEIQQECVQATQPEKGLEIMAITASPLKQPETQPVPPVHTDFELQHDLPVSFTAMLSDLPQFPSSCHVSSGPFSVYASMPTAFTRNLSTSASVVPYLNAPGHDAASLPTQEPNNIEKLFAEIAKLNKKVDHLEEQQKKNHEEVMQKLSLCQACPPEQH